ncbi:ribosomal protein L7/L12 [Streptomyces sp. NPDC127084]|uniref:ribosomal protein L7/L12 n=1 Tax=Streptomyces sp. NPDC127084 TaxID=3347133 RepID=UPI003653F9B5
MEIAVLLTVIAVLMLSGSVELKLSRMERRISRLERKLDQVLGHMGVSEPADPRLERVTALLREGRKIEAIKVYRGVTDADLKEAKDAVERMEAGL